MKELSVLVVEDHDAVRRSLCELLQSGFPGITCLEASSGEEAVDMASAADPMVVLMDIGLPGISGIEATRRIRARSPATRVVIVSIFDTAAHRADAAAAGAVGYVPKIELGHALLPVLARLLKTGGNGHGAPTTAPQDRCPAAADEGGPR